MPKHTPIRLRDGTEIDPRGLWQRFNTVTNLVRALGNSFDACNQPEGAIEPREACAGIVALLEAVNNDLSMYLNHQTPKEMEADDAKYRARLAARMPPGHTVSADAHGANEAAPH